MKRGAAVSSIGIEMDILYDHHPIALLSPVA